AGSNAGHEGYAQGRGWCRFLGWPRLLAIAKAQPRNEPVASFSPRCDPRLRPPCLAGLPSPPDATSVPLVGSTRLTPGWRLTLRPTQHPAQRGGPAELATAIPRDRWSRERMRRNRLELFIARCFS